MVEAADVDRAARPTMRSPSKLPGARASQAIKRLLEATQAVFLDRGYSGTTVEEIARAAGMSRASFYTYFPTKRDALLALGLNAVEATTTLDRDTAADLAGGEEGVRRWVEARWAQLETWSGFTIAWTEAARDDDALRVPGMRRHLRSCEFVGRTLGVTEPGDARALGLVVFSMLERSWSFCSLYGEAVDDATVRADIVRAIVGLAKSQHLQ